MNDAPEQPAPLYVSSLDEVAAALGTTERQWRTYAKRPGFPAKTDKGYDLTALAAWKAENISQRGDGKLAAKKIEKLEEEIRLLRLKAAKEEKKVVDMGAVEELHGKLALRLKAFLYSKFVNEAPPKIAGCDALYIRKYNQAACDEAVRTLAKDIEQWTTE